MRRIVAAAFAVTLCASAASAAPYSDIYAFGDSLSDVGNVFALTGQPSAPYYGGRFSNGPIWLDDLAARLGTAPLQPSTVGGTDYAWGGARVGNNGVPLTGPAALVPTLAQQESLFALAHPTADPNALYTVWAGSNDVFAAVSAIAGGTLQVSDALAANSVSVATEVGDLKALVAGGARNLLVVGLTDLGLAPAVAGPGSSLASALAADYDAKLAAALAGIPLATVSFLDPFPLSDTIAANPGGFGFTDPSTPCYTVPGFVGDPNYTTDGSVCSLTKAGQDSHVFWDEVHPTERSGQLIANAAFNALPVPEPACGGLLALAVGALLGLRRTRRT